MAAGVPGDHPLTDIIRYGREVYSPEVDALVREISALADDRQAHDFADMLLRHPPGRGSAAQLRPRLTEMRDHLRAQARERGWEVD